MSSDVRHCLLDDEHTILVQVRFHIQRQVLGADLQITIDAELEFLICFDREFNPYRFLAVPNTFQQNIEWKLHFRVRCQLKVPLRRFDGPSIGSESRRGSALLIGSSLYDSA